MLFVLSRLLLLGLTALTGTAAPEPASTDQDRLQGTWNATSYEADGKKTPAKDLARWRLIVAGNRMTAKDGDEVLEEWTFTLIPTRKPGAIDLKPVGGVNKDRLVRGVYRLEGDALTVCVGEPGKDRPAGFSTTEGGGHLLLAFQKPRK